MTVKLATCACHIAIALLAMLMLTGYFYLGSL